MNCVRPWLRSIALCCAVLLSAGSLFALDPAKSVYQYNCLNWTRRNGLPADLITGVTQTKDGYIWLGTQKGMVRFDGVDFKLHTMALPEGQSQEIRSVSRASVGTARKALAALTATSPPRPVWPRMTPSPPPRAKAVVTTVAESSS